MEVDKNKKLTWLDVDDMIKELKGSRKKNIVIKKDDLIYLLYSLKQYKLVDYVARHMIKY